MARGLDALGAEIAERLELPAGTAGLVKLTLMGRSRALIENHRGISSSSAVRAEVKLVSGVLRIDGEGLELTALDRSALLVSGRILALSFL